MRRNLVPLPRGKSRREGGGRPRQIITCAKLPPACEAEMLRGRAELGGGSLEAAAALVDVHPDGDQIPLTGPNVLRGDHVAVGEFNSVLVFGREPPGAADFRAVDIGFVGMIDVLG